MATFSALKNKKSSLLYIIFCLFTCLFMFLYISWNLVGTVYQQVENYLPIDVM